MSDEIVFYHNPNSRSLMAHWMLEEVGAPYRIELLRFDRGEHKRDAFLKLNPMGKLPTIVHRGTVVTETAAICAYLADAFPEAGLAPALGDPARGTYFRWLVFGAGCVEPALADKMLGRPVESPSRLAWGSYEDTVRALDLALSPGPFILGDRFSAADVYIGSEIGWALMMGGLEAKPLYSAYLERLTARPAHRRVTAQSEALNARLSA